MTDATRQIIDYAMDGDAVNFRQALYSDIHDRVTAHLDAAKQVVAQNMFQPEQDDSEVEQSEDENV